MSHFAITRLLVIALFLPITLFAQTKLAETLTGKTESLQKIDGYIPLYWDRNTGKMLMEISRLNEEFLYQISLPAGVGSNPIGLDRGQLGRTFVVYFERIGNKILLFNRIIVTEL